MAEYGDVRARIYSVRIGGGGRSINKRTRVTILSGHLRQPSGAIFQERALSLLGRDLCTAVGTRVIVVQLAYHVG